MTGHERYLGKVDVGAESCHHVHRRGALQRQQPTTSDNFHGDVAAAGLEVGHLGLDVGQILVLVPCVDDQVHVIARVGADAVVDQPSVVVRDGGQRAHILGQLQNVAEQERLHEARTVSAVEAHRHHVRDVKEPGLLARMQVRVHDPSLLARVLDGHVPPAKRDHSRAK